ncbi:hypothetical protein [Hoylesella loescheii]|uniref:hypothetical protein n=1 Tax=Hoylesella loescheii TaxID=840 RepID=UPI00248E2AA7|nr:hypothetical protein [Hoylesella loescheii]
MKKPRDTSLPGRQSSNRRQCDERVELLEVIKEMVEAEVDRRLGVVFDHKKKEKKKGMKSGRQHPNNNKDSIKGENLKAGQRE